MGRSRAYLLPGQHYQYEQEFDGRPPVCYDGGPDPLLARLIEVHGSPPPLGWTEQAEEEERMEAGR